MDAKGGEVGTVAAQLNEPPDCDAREKPAWLGTQLEDLHHGHRSRQVDEDIVIYRRGATDATGVSDQEGRELFECKQR